MLYLVLLGHAVHDWSFVGPRVSNGLRKVALLICGWMVLVSNSHAQNRPLSTNDLVQPDAVHSVTISPDGRFVAYLERTDEFTPLARKRDRTLNPEQFDFLHAVRVLDLAEGFDESSEALELDGDSPVWVRWAGVNRLLVGVVADSEANGHERPTNWRHPYYPYYFRILSIDVMTGEIAVLFGDDGAWDMRVKDIPATLINSVVDDPESVLVAAKFSDNAFDLWRVSTITGAARRVEHGRNHTINWRTNENGEAVFRLDFDAERDQVRVYRRADGEQRWRRTDRFTLEEFDDRLDRARRSIWVADTDDNDEVLVAVRPDDAERRGIYHYNIENDERGELFWEHPVYDLRSVIRNTYSDRLIAATYVDDRLRMHFFDGRTDSHYRAIASFFEPDAVVRPVEVYENAMLIRVFGPQEPTTYYAYLFADSSIIPVAAVNPVLFQTRLSPVTVENYQARDGENIQAYLTRPVGHTMESRPLIVMPHGGPELRDNFGFDFVAQYFASEGWAVLQPNFRGSDGFGRQFMEAGHRQWGRRMQDDITDGVQWLIDNGMVDPNRVCIVGFSYGGYAALAGALVTPDLYQCAVSIAGVSHLPRMMEWEAQTYPESYDFWRARIGDPDVDADDLVRYSPALRANEITTPILLLHGSADEIVPIEQSILMRDALVDAGAEHRYLRLNGADHDLSSPLSLARALALMESFIGDYLDVGPTPEDRISWSELTETPNFNLSDRRTQDETELGPEMIEAVADERESVSSTPSDEP